MTGREAALKALYEIDKNGAFCDKALKTVLTDNELGTADKALATELVMGVTDKKLRLDYIISKYSSQKLKKLSFMILNILRMGVYQLLFLDKIPQSAAVNESVKLARRYGHKASAGFVNAVLRTVSREGDVKYSDDYIYYSVPKWIDELVTNQYGRETAVKIYEAFSKPSPTTVRVNTLKTDVKTVTFELEKLGIDVKKTSFENVLEIKSFGDMSKLKLFNDGYFTPQDMSAYLAAHTVCAAPGELIIDVCAAPGGKTTQLAEESGDKAKIVAFDIYPHKVDIIKNNCSRLNINSVDASLWDSTNVNPSYVGKADKVLADVLCSGLGVIGKKFDIKWKRTAEDIEKIIQIQKSVLSASVKYLKSGGIMVYSTCTINKDENENLIKEFVENNGLEILEQKTILPFENGDGFFICKLRR